MISSCLFKSQSSNCDQPGQFSIMLYMGRVMQSHQPLFSTNDSFVCFAYSASLNIAYLAISNQH